MVKTWMKLVGQKLDPNCRGEGGPNLGQKLPKSKVGLQEGRGSKLDQRSGLVTPSALPPEQTHFFCGSLE